FSISEIDQPRCSKIAYIWTDQGVVAHCLLDPTRNAPRVFSPCPRLLELGDEFLESLSVKSLNAIEGGTNSIHHIRAATRRQSRSLIKANVQALLIDCVEFIHDHADDNRLVGTSV